MSVNRGTTVVDPDCELCEAARFTEWFFEDDLCWIAECEMCAVPMVVWREHDPDPPADVRSVLHSKLAAVVSEHFGYELWIDDNMRTIPTHYHAHGRPRGGFYGHGLRRTAHPEEPNPMNNLPRPDQLLPHRPPFLLVDEFISIEPGVSAAGIWRITGDEYFFPGHFPGRPTLPGVLMCESIAQVGAAAVLADARFAGKLPLFGGLDKARFRRQVVPGDELVIEVELGRMSARAGKGSGTARVGDEIACQGELLFVIADA